MTQQKYSIHLQAIGFSPDQSERIAKFLATRVSNHPSLFKWISDGVDIALTLRKQETPTGQPIQV